jgi:hypothetical protein
MITVRHRHDLQETTRVDMEIEVFNRKLHIVLKTVDNVKIIQANLIRNNFTLHGLHQNISGKGNMAVLTGENVKETKGKKRRNPLHSVMLRKSEGSYSGRNQGKINK